MSVIAEAVRALMDAGVTGDALVEAIARMEAAQAAERGSMLTARQARNARYYERTRDERKAKRDALKASESDLNQTFKTLSDDFKTLKTDGSAPPLDGRPSPPAPPHPTLNPSPLPETHTHPEGERVENFEAETGPEPKTQAEPVQAKPRRHVWPADFREQFWAAYPRRIEKKAAMAKLEAIRTTDRVPFAAIMDGVEKLKALGKEPEFIKYPHRWLAGERWADEDQPTNSRRETGNFGNRPRTAREETSDYWANEALAADARIRNAKGQANVHERDHDLGTLDERDGAAEPRPFDEGRGSPDPRSTAPRSSHGFGRASVIESAGAPRWDPFRTHGGH